METTIQLSYPEIMQAATIGVMRRMQRLKSGYALAHGLKPGKDWQLMIEGALSECALAKFLNVYWVGCGEINDVDVGDVDVRSTTYHNGHLIIHKSDDSNRKYYLLTGIDGKYTVRGWIWGHEAKKDEFWGELEKGRPAYNIPQSELHTTYE